MDEEPDRIRGEIEATRMELARDVNALADRTVPTRVARRRWTATKRRMRGISDRVMGTPAGRYHGDHAHSVADSVRDRASTAADAGRHAVEQVGDQAKEVAGDVADTVRRGPQLVGQQTQGNPVAAGLIAFGVGLLGASLIPVSGRRPRPPWTTRATPCAGRPDRPLVARRPGSPRAAKPRGQ